MLNAVDLTGTIQPGYQDQPAVRQIVGKTGDIVGYACRVRFDGGYIAVAHWNKSSLLASKSESDTIEIVGSLKTDAYQDKDGRKVYALKIDADAIREV